LEEVTPLVCAVCERGVDVDAALRNNLKMQSVH
jgi:hypothetical protein